MKLPDYLSDRKARSTIFAWLALGLVLRLVLMPTTMHPDILYVYQDPQLFAYHGVLNQYDYLSENGMCTVKGGLCYAYPQLAYYFFGFYEVLLTPFKGFHAWLDSLQAFKKTGIDTVTALSLTTPGVYFPSLFLMKLPYLFFDLAAAFLLLWIAGERRKALFSFKFWMVNPIVLYSSFVFGQFDAIPVFFIVLATYFVLRNKSVRSVLSLGIGGAFKQSPLLLLAPAALAFGKSNAERVKLFLLGAVPYLVFFVPLLGSAAFRQNLFYSSSTSSDLSAFVPKFFASHGLPAIDLATVFIAAYVLLVAFMFLKRMRAKDSSTKDFLNYSLAVFLLFYALTFFGFHYLLWAAPFLVLKSSEDKRFFKAHVLLIALSFAFLLQGKLVSTALFTPLSPAFSSMPVPAQVIGEFVPWIAVFAVARIGFSLTCLWMVWLLLREDVSSVWKRLPQWIGQPFRKRVRPR
jgi:hypothetical protein